MAAGLGPSSETSVAPCKTQTQEAKEWAENELRAKEEEKRKLDQRQGSLAAAFAKARVQKEALTKAAVFYIIALFFFANNIAFSVAENFYCRQAFTSVYELGAQAGWDAGVAATTSAFRPGARASERQALSTYPVFDTPDWPRREPYRTTYLKQAVNERDSFNAQIIKHTTTVSAATYISDGWRDGIYKNEQINEFLLTAVGCIFIQAVFTGAMGKTAENLCNVMCSGLEKAKAMGAVVRFVVTDGAANAKLCGKMVMLKMPFIFAYICVAHGLDLAFEDVGKLDFIKDTLSKALELVSFILTYEKLIVLLCTNGADLKLMKPAKTRFGYAYIVLWTLLQDKAALKKLFSDPVTEAWILGTPATTNTKRVRDRRIRFNSINDDIVNSSRFWNGLELCLKVMEPLWMCLRQLDKDTATLSKVAPLLYSTVNRIVTDKTIDTNLRVAVEKVFVGPNGRLEYILSDIHLAAPFFDPEFHNTKGNGESLKLEWRSHILPVMSRYFEGDETLTAKCYQQFKQYEHAVIIRNDDGKVIGGYDQAVWSVAKMMHPSEWHRDFTSPWAPEFGHFAADICGAFAATSRGERLHKDFGRVHTSDRANLTTQRVFDLASVRNFLRLKAAVDEAGWQVSFMEWTAERTVVERLETAQARAVQLDTQAAQAELEADLRAVFGADGRPPKTFMSLLLDSDDEGSDSDDEPAAVGGPPPVGALD